MHGWRGSAITRSSGVSAASLSLHIPFQPPTGIPAFKGTPLSFIQRLHVLKRQLPMLQAFSALFIWQNRGLLLIAHLSFVHLQGAQQHRVLDPPCAGPAVHWPLLVWAWSFACLPLPLHHRHG